MMIGYTTDLESLKTLFTDKCETKVLTNEDEPLKSIYLAAQHPEEYPLDNNNWHDEFGYYPMLWHADSSPGAVSWPSIVTACRPKGGSDADIIKCATTHCHASKLAKVFTRKSVQISTLLCIFLM